MARGMAQKDPAGQRCKKSDVRVHSIKFLKINQVKKIYYESFRKSQRSVALHYRYEVIVIELLQ